MQYLEETQIKNFDYDVFMDHWKNAKTLMNSKDESNLIPNFYEHTHRLDKIRDESFIKVFPQLHAELVRYA
jgi:hypothetical protein